MLKTQSVQPQSFSENQIRKNNFSFKKWITATLICLIILSGTCSLIFQGEKEQLKSRLQPRILSKDQQIFQFKYDLTISPQLKQVNGKQIKEYFKFQSEQEIQRYQLNLEEQSILISFKTLKQLSVPSNEDQQKEIIDLMSGKENLVFKAKINKDGNFIEFNSIDGNQFEVAQALAKRIISQSLKIFSKSNLPHIQSKRMLFSSTMVYSEVDFLNFAQDQLQQEEEIVRTQLQAIEEYSDYREFYKNNQINEDENQSETIYEEEKQNDKEEQIDNTSNSKNQQDGYIDKNQQQNNQTTQVEQVNLDIFEHGSSQFQQFDNITHDQFDHDNSNFQQDYQYQQNSNDDNNLKSSQLRLTQENQNSSVTDENWGHDGSNFQQDSLINKFIEKRLNNSTIFKLKSDNYNITHDQFDHDGSNFQQDSSIKQFIEKKLKDRADFKLKFQSDNKNITHSQFDHYRQNFKKNYSNQQQSSNYNNNQTSIQLRITQENQNSTVTDENWGHDGSNFQQDSLLNQFIEKRLNNPAIFKLKSDNENITHDQFDHDGSNFQQDSSIKQFIEKKLKDRADFKLKFQSDNKNITHGQFDHYRQNFKKNYSNQQQSSNYNNNQTSIQLRITQENQNSTVTDENWGHDGSNFQQDSLINKFIEKRLNNPAIFKLKSDNENITHDQFDHDGSNFQQDSSIKQFIEKKLKDRADFKLKFQSDNKNITHSQFDHYRQNFKKNYSNQQQSSNYNNNQTSIQLRITQENQNSTVTDENWGHDGSNFQQDSLLNQFIEKRLNNPAIFKLKSDNENITHDQFDHDGSNFQQDFSIKQLIEKKLKDRANLKLKFLSNNKNITHGQFDHYRQNFKKNYSNQQQSSNYNNNQTSIQLRITQENQNSTVTDENWGHDGSNFQQDSLLNQFIEKRLKNAAIFKLKSDNENITHDQFDHDGSNFQQDSSIKQFIEKKLKDRANLKLKFLSDNKNNTHDQFDHNGSNFKQDFYKVNLQKQKNENQTITNDNWNHDGQNFQHYSLDKQKNYFENHKKNILTIASQPEDGKNLPYLSKEVTIYKNKIFSQIIELRIAQNIYQEYTKFIYNLYINNQQHSQIHEIVMNTNSILSCTAQSQPQKQQAIQKNIEIINSVFGILNIPLKYEFNFLIDHSYEIIPQDSKCDISFLTQVKVQVDSHEGLQIIGQNENGFRVNGLLINEICLFNFTVDTQQLSISSEINKQQGEIRYSVGQYYRKQICDQKFSSIQIQDVTKQLRKSLQTPFETKCHLSDMQDDEQNQTTFVNKGQDESAINLTKQIDFIKFN